MTTIDPRASVLAALQMRLSARRPSSRTGGPARARGGAPPDAAAQALAQRLAAIDRSDPDGRRKAVRVLLEAQLAREFGTALLNDPAFPGMVEAVQLQLEGDAQAGAAVRTLGDWLLSAPA
ncbi:hypothetical protein H8N03_08445 [Ramlibacter sp. USB13]|uniref:Uncharacterized protein n=1 Tax=Ramlibacter cellulosilyticus TaxID=2764187 RepID=A0A923MQH7_9BURK|nr:hypothetical protein [Ramlibacter cellulosilyticus]MBC5782973.1 hypothetical protein [Ramlibacter cellulosilyticus]